MVRFRTLISLLWFSCAIVRADVTVRYAIDVKLSSKLPIPAEQSAKLHDFIPKQMVVRIQGDKTWTSFSAITAIADLRSGQITFLDARGKKFAAMPIAEYPPVPSTPALPPEVQKMLENLKLDVQRKQTGRQGMVRGIRAEERQTTLSVEIPVPGKGPVGLKLEMEQWLALPEEITRLPGLEEFIAHSAKERGPFSPAEMIQRSLAQVPQLAKQLRDAFEAAGQDQRSFTAKSRMRFYLPLVATAVPGFSADEPLFDLSIELAELSTAPVPESIFQVPADYQSASMEELLKSIFPAPPAGPATTGGVFRVGGGVTAPALMYKVEPKYTPEATSDHIQGTVILYCEVQPTGEPHNIKVVRSLRADLDQKAIEALSQWRFKPGEKDGKPVTVAATIEVNFRLLDNPPPPR